MEKTKLIAAVVDEQGQVALPPALRTQLGWDSGRHLLAFQGPQAEAILALSAAPYLLLIEPKVLYAAVMEAKENIWPADAK